VTTSPLPAPGKPLAHYVSSAPFDPASIEAMTDEHARIYMASQWRLMWWKFKRHKVALASGIFLASLYSMIFICEFLAPYNLHTRNVDFINSPPQGIHLFHEGSFVGPFVYGRDMKLDIATLKRGYTDNKNKVHAIRFLCRGDSYKFWGLWEGNFHLICPAEDGQLFLLGTDRLGRDLLSRDLGDLVRLDVRPVGDAVGDAITLEAADVGLHDVQVDRDDGRVPQINGWQGGDGRRHQI